MPNVCILASDLNYHCTEVQSHIAASVAVVLLLVLFYLY